MTPVRDRLRPAIPLFVAMLFLLAPPVYAESELLLFADVAMDFREFPAELEPVMEEQGIDPHLSLFATRDGNRFRFLFEAAASEQEAEIERFQLGLRLSPAATLWLGRFHNPFDYWTSRMHHGRYLQTSRSRPGIFQFEDEGGILPIHVAGLLLEGLHISPGDHGWRYDLALGVGPRVIGTSTGSRLETPTLRTLIEDDGGHKQVATLRLAYLPDVIADDELGFFISRVTIPSQNLAFIDGDIEQLSAGLFGHWRYEQFQAFGALTYFRHRMNRLAGGGSQLIRHQLSNYYLQGEYLWRPAWTAFARQEDSHGVDDDAYVQSFAMLVVRRSLLGLRYELNHNQALTLEVDRTRYQQGDKSFNALSLQWSAVFP